MTNASASKVESHPPLARDAAGNLLPIPEGTQAFKVCRETPGRPREVRGPDKSPVRFPLSTSPDDLLELCGAGIYRVYALDELGELLDGEPVAKWDLTAPIRELRNAATVDPVLSMRSDRPVAATATPPSDLRFALETMAQMMRTNTDALRLVAESQVDLAKAIATAKGLPRNAATIAPPPPVANQNADEEEDDHDDDDEPQLEDDQPEWMKSLVPIAGAVAHNATKAVIDHFTKPTGGNPDGGPPDGDKPEETKPNPGFEFADLLDWRRPQKRAQQQAEQRRASAEQASERVPVITQQAIMAKAMALAPLLEPDERARLMDLWRQIVPQLGNPVVARSLAELLAMPNEKAIEWVRVHLAEIEKGLS